MATNKESKASTTENPGNPELRPSAKSPKTDPAKDKQRCPRHILSLSALTLAVLVGIATLYLAWYISTLDRGIKEELSMTNTTIANVVEQQKNGQVMLKKQQQLLQEQLASQIKTLVRLDEKFTQALEERGYQQEDWQLLKARYFLEMAKINSHWQQDPLLSRRMLEQADQLLQPIHNPKLFQVRQSIAQEIQHIDTLKQADTIGLLSQIDALQTAVEQLPVVPEKRADSQDAPPQDTSSKTGWREHWANSVHLLEKLVVIRHHHGDVLPLLLPEQKQLLKARMQLSLQQAQLALMQRNETQFHQAIKQSLQQLAQFSGDDKSDTIHIQKRLHALTQVSITLQQAPTGQALEQLNRLIPKTQGTQNTLNSEKEQDKAD
ncbi:MAG: uroporphyrinogen-III C-methyltransferase [Legionellaceae bacterium]|nr:uroporphyrinogen-III C-methyltransferase [Legionellaceae bacterium]